MKKITLTLLLVLSSALGFSQLFESFENTTGPDAAPSTNWTLGSGNWAVFDTNVGGTIRWVTNPNSYAGTNCAYVTRENIAQGITTEEYLATPLVTIPANGELNFYSRSFTAGGQGTIYQVKIAPVGASQTNPADYVLLAEFDENQLSTVFNVYEEKTIDLTPFAGVQVYIAFVKKYTQPTVSISGDRWLLDNVAVQSRNTCLKPINLISTNITTTSVTLDWTDTSGVTEWEVIAIPTGSTVVTAATTGGITTNSHPFTMTNLNSYTNYTFYVRAICSSNDKSDWSTALFLTTLESCPSPSNIITSAITSTTVTINWLDNSSATSWEVIALPCGSPAPLFLDSGTTSSINSYIFTNLNSLTCYSFYVRSVCSPSDSGVWSGPFSFTTLDLPQVCGGNFVDSSGPNANYANNLDYTVTICPSNPGELVTVTFTTFDTETNWDGLLVYDGNSTNSPQLASSNGVGFSGLANLPGAFWGTTIPSPFTSSSPDGCLTFRFISNASVTRPGWTANVTCTQDDDKIILIAFVDSNNNGTKEADETTFSNGSFVYDLNDSGTPMTGYSPTGLYAIYDAIPTNSYDISYQLQSTYAPYFSAGTTNYSNVTIPVGGLYQILYFPITVTQSYNDVTVSIIPQNPPPRPGFTYTEIVVYRNLGLTPTSGTLTFTKDSVVTITNVSQAGTVANATGFTYAFANLAPYETRFIHVTILVPTLPTVSLGDVLTNIASISAPADEINLENNSFSNSQIIVGSYDPNDKMESHGGRIYMDEYVADDYLYYTIRFQNEGTANAEFVIIEDVLDNQIDESTIETISASHNYNMTRMNNEVSWDFRNINLPPASVNVNGSMGYVTFRVQLNPGIVAGDIVPNTANIFFDFNPAIVTNTFNTEFVQALGTTNFESNNFVIFPNPTNENVTISLQNTSETIDSITITDVLGKTILNIKDVSSNQLNIDAANVSQGVYFVEIITQNNVKQVKKLIKK